MEKKRLKLWLWIIIVSIILSVLPFYLYRKTIGRHVEIEKLLPDDAVAFMEINDLAKIWNKAVSEKSVAKLMGAAGKNILPGLNEKDFEKTVNATMTLVGKRLILVSKENPDKTPGFLVFSQVEVVGRLTAEIIRQVAERRIKNVRFSSVEYAGHRVNIVTAGTAESFCYIFIGDVLVVSNSLALVEQTLDRFKEGRTGIISPFYKKTRSSLPDSKEIFLFYDIRKVSGDSKGLKAAGLSVKLTDKGLECDGSLLVDIKDSDKAFPGIRVKPGKPMTLEWQPPDVSLYADAFVDCKGILQNVPDTQRDTVKGLGINLDELASCLGQEYSVSVSAAEHEEQYPRLDFMAEVRDQGRMSEVMQQIEKLVGFGGMIRFKDRIYKGEKIRYASFPMSLPSICWTFYRNFVVISNSPESIEKIIDVSRKESPGITSSPAWKQIKDEMSSPGNGAAFINPQQALLMADCLMKSLSDSPLAKAGGMEKYTGPGAKLNELKPVLDNITVAAIKMKIRDEIIGFTIYVK